MVFFFAVCRKEDVETGLWPQSSKKWALQYGTGRSNRSLRPKKSSLLQQQRFWIFVLSITAIDIWQGCWSKHKLINIIPHLLYGSYTYSNSLKRVLISLLRELIIHHIMWFDKELVFETLNACFAFHKEICNLRAKSHLLKDTNIKRTKQAKPMFMSLPSHHDHHQQTTIARTVVPGSSNQSIYSKVDKTKQKRKQGDQNSRPNSDSSSIQKMKEQKKIDGL